MKKSAHILIMLIVSLSLLVSSSHAGNKRNRHHDVMKGVIIGAGTAIIGAAIINELSHHKHRGYHNNCHDCKSSSRRPPREICDSNGYYKIKKIWVEPRYRNHRVPGHYDRRGCWVPGRSRRICVSKGHWVKKKIWVESPCYSSYDRSDYYE